MSLLNRRDLRGCIMMSMSFSVIVMNFLAKLIASVSSFSVMEDKSSRCQILRRCVDLCVVPM